MMALSSIQRCCMIMKTKAKRAVISLPCTGIDPFVRANSHILRALTFQFQGLQIDYFSMRHTLFPQALTHPRNETIAKSYSTEQNVGETWRIRD